MGNFREITILGDVLDDERLSDNAKILYGKISRLSFKEGYCWASNKFFDSTKSGNTASRNIKELEKYGYITCFYENYNRKIYICEIDSRVSKSGETPSPKMVNKHPLDLTLQEEQQKRTDNFSLSQELNPNQQDLSQRLTKISGIWNDLGLKPPFRKIIVNLTHDELSSLIKAMNTYSDDLIIQAIKNYARILSDPQKYDPGGCEYKSFIGFLSKGVEKYCDEATPFEIFKTKNSRSPPEQRQFGKLSQGSVDYSVYYEKYGITGSFAEKERRLREMVIAGEASLD
jgi:hypothetical protein